MKKILFLDDATERHKAICAAIGGLCSNNGKVRMDNFYCTHYLTRTDEQIAIFHVFTAYDVIEKFLNGTYFNEVWLDHDLGISIDGMFVVDFLCREKKIARPEKVFIHSANFIRAEEMEMRLRDHGYINVQRVQLCLTK